MGWTHYWEREKELPANEFKRAVSDCKKIIELLDISLAGPDGSGQPVFANDEIVFNGVASSNCEPFVFRRMQPPRPGRNIVLEYCKTEHLPYDLAVQCCLVILKYRLNDLIMITSDGSEEDWSQAKQVCSDSIGIDNMPTILS